MSSPSNTEGDSMKAPLLDVQFGGPRRTVVPTISYFEFIMSSEQMQPLYTAINRQQRHIFKTKLDRNYYIKHGAVPFATMVWERGKWLRDLGMYTHPIQINLGSYHGARGEYEKAIDCYKQVFDQFSFLQDNLAGTILHKAIGRLCYATSRYEEALDHFSKANLLRKRMQEQQRDRWFFQPDYTYEFISSIAPTIYRNDYHSLGSTYKALGRNDEALEKFQQAVQSLRDGGYGRNIEFAVSLTKVGELHESIGNISDAVKAYRKALEIHLLNEGEFPRTTAVARLHNKLGDLRCKDEGDNEDGEGETADGHWNIAVEVYRRAGKTDEDIEITRLQSKLRESLGVV